MNRRIRASALTMLLWSVPCLSCLGAESPSLKRDLKTEPAPPASYENSLFHRHRHVSIFRLTPQGIGIQTRWLDFELNLTYLDPLPRKQVLCLSFRFGAHPPDPR
jgi:hypothetical protein